MKWQGLIHKKGIHITGKSVISWKTMHFVPKRSCASTKGLMSEGQLGASLQNVVSQAQSPTATQGLSQQPVNVLFQSGDHSSVCLRLMTVDGDLFWSICAM